MVSDYQIVEFDLLTRTERVFSLEESAAFLRESGLVGEPTSGQVEGATGVGDWVAQTGLPENGVPEEGAYTQEESVGGDTDLIDPTIIFGGDGRTRVAHADLVTYPWSAQGRLWGTFPGETGSYSGSGTMVDHCFYLTAGHCVHQGGAGGVWANQVSFSPGQDWERIGTSFQRSEYQFWGEAWATQLFTFTGWTDSKDWDLDLAWVLLDRNIGNYTGWLGFGYNSSDSWYSRTANLSGYPGDLTPTEYDQWFQTGNARDYGITTDQLRTDTMDVYPGQSGSGLYYVYDPGGGSGSYVHGVTSHHLYTDSNGNGQWDPGEPGFYNAFTRITEGKFDAIVDVIDNQATPADRPDLTDYDTWFNTNYAYFSPAKVVTGDSLTVRSVVRNNGTAAAGAFSVSFYLSRTSSFSPDYLLGTVPISSLSPFQWADAIWSGPLPGGIPKGLYYVGWIIDSTNTQTEFAEDNNTGVIWSSHLEVSDAAPPTPNPMTWFTEPYQTSTSAISMWATLATDETPPVQYYFDFVSSPTEGSGGTDSGWGTSRTYTDAGLDANHQYGYRVRAQDSMPTPNVGAYSATSYEYTDIETPAGIAFGTITTTSIQAKSSSTPSGLTRGSSGLIVYNTTKGTNSGWKQNNEYWNSTGLSVNTHYGFDAQARNGDADATDYCSLWSRYTLANPPAAAPFSDVTPTSIRANWGANGNPGETQYLCENTTAHTNSGWIMGTSWNETGLTPGRPYHYQVKARNGDRVETAIVPLGDQTTPAPEIVVRGNGISITDGDTTPSTTDGTDFASVVQTGTTISHTFTVRNDGNATLNLGTVTVPTGFTLTEGLSTSLAPAASDTFTVRLDTTVLGAKAGDVSFSTDDPDESPFNFRITGIVCVQGANLALSKPGVASTSYTGMPPSNVTDGNPGTRWSSQFSNNEWVYVDLGAVYTIGRVVLRWEAAYGRGYKIQVSNDASTWSDAYTTTTGDGGVDDVVLSTLPSGRYVRMLGTQRATTYGYSLFELEVYGGTAGPEIMVLGNGTSIADGDSDAAPSTSDGTGFGLVVLSSSVTHTFTITNMGSAALNLTGSPKVTLSGSSDFSVAAQPSSPVAVWGSTTFQIRFTPSGEGLKTATVQIANDDGNENPYDFTVVGKGLDALWLMSSDVPKPIPDVQTIVSTRPAAGLPGVISDVDVIVRITHTWDNDMDVYLISPLGTRVELFTDVGSSGDNFDYTVLDDAASTSIVDGSTPFADRYRPEGLLSVLNGQNPNGTWQLEVTDDLSGDTGTLQGWGLRIRVLAPEITVLGNTVSITDGDTTPSAADGTDFGSVTLGGPAASRTFTVRNDGTAALTLGVVTVPTGFTLTESLSTTLAAGASDTFTVQLDTATLGTKSGDVSFTTNDSDENPFNFTITGIVNPAAGNLALGKTVVASTSYTGFPASNVTDGNTSSRWSSQFSDSQWLYVDLGSAYTINRVVLRWETAYGKGYKLQVSSDASSWSDAYSTTAGDGGVDDITLSTPASGRYLRILGIQRATTYGYSLYEVEVYGGPVPNLALTKPAVASTSYAGFPAASATDGNASSRWSSQFSDSQWLYVDLGSTFSISRVVLRWEAAYGRSYKLQVSGNASTWSDVYSTTTGDGGVDDLTLSTPALGRYLRMLGTQRATTYGYSLYELEVYGAPVANLALAKPAVASTSYTGMPASNATDGNASTRWSSQFSDSQWLYVDLGSVYTIKQVVLRWEAAYGRGYKLQVSHDASSWSDVYSTTAGAGGVDDITLSSPASGRYVRLLGTQRATTFGYSLWEFEVYG